MASFTALNGAGPQSGSDSKPSEPSSQLPHEQGQPTDQSDQQPQQQHQEHQEQSGRASIFGPVAGADAEAGPVPGVGPGPAPATGAEVGLAAGVAAALARPLSIDTSVLDRWHHTSRHHQSHPDRTGQLPLPPPPASFDNPASRPSSSGKRKRSASADSRRARSSTSAATDLRDQDRSSHSPVLEHSRAANDEGHAVNGANSVDGTNRANDARHTSSANGVKGAINARAAHSLHRANHTASYRDYSPDDHANWQQQQLQHHDHADHTEGSASPALDNDPDESAESSPDTDKRNTHAAFGSPLSDNRAGDSMMSDAKKRKRNFSNRTKTGCMTCRRRKKKCDENKPHCTNCTRGGFLCQGYSTQRGASGWQKPESKIATVPLESKDPSYVPPSAYGNLQPQHQSLPLLPPAAILQKREPLPLPPYRGQPLRIDPPTTRQRLTEDDRPTASTIPSSTATTSPDNKMSALSALTQTTSLFSTPVSAQAALPSYQKDYPRVPPLHDMTRTEPESALPASDQLPRISVFRLPRTSSPIMPLGQQPPPQSQPLPLQPQSQQPHSHQPQPQLHQPLSKQQPQPGPPLTTRTPKPQDHHQNHQNHQNHQKIQNHQGQKSHQGLHGPLSHLDKMPLAHHFPSAYDAQPHRFGPSDLKNPYPDSRTGPAVVVTPVDSRHWTSKDHMLTGQLFYSHDKELVWDRERCIGACWRFNDAMIPSRGISLQERMRLFRDIIVPRDPSPFPSKKQLLGYVGDNLLVEAPFSCEYGYNMFIGHNVIIGRNCTFMDARETKIGDNCRIGPNVSCYTSSYPIDSTVRTSPGAPASALPIAIGEDCFIGGSVIILPGRTIGRGSTVGAGSVVTKDVPPYTVVAGNPLRIIRAVGSNGEEPTRYQEIP